MRIRHYQFIIFILFPVFLQAASLSDSYVNAIVNNDYLAVRILIKKMSRKKMSFQQWYSIRKVLQNTPQVGWGIIYPWEGMYKKQFLSQLAKEDSLVSQADQQMLNNNFEDAFLNYQKALQSMKPKIRKKSLQEKMLFHRMARALYGAGRFEESLEVYDWLGNDYIFLRQVLFEKTWAAFKANKIERALGLIVSQHSPLIRLTMEPEIFLMQFYIYKRLCRDEDAKKVVSELHSQIEYLKTRATWREWAQSDFQNLWLIKLIESKNIGSGVSNEERSKERKKIEDMIKKAFVIEKKRLQEQAEHMLAYMNLAIEQDPKVLLKIKKLPDREKLLSSGQDIWSAEEAEDWSDEIGLHYFVGDSLCKK